MHMCKRDGILQTDLLNKWFSFFPNSTYLKPPPIAAPTTILRQPLNVLYRTPVEAVKLNSK